jgi:peptidyl-prolyl cis-trans isomerase C
MTTLQRLLAVGAFAIAGSGCSQNQATADGENNLGPGHVATVNGQPIAESVLRVYALASARKNLDDLTAEERGKLLDDLIGVELLRQQAEKDGLTNSRTVAAQIELQKLQLIARAAATSYLEKNPATDDELQKIYDENLPRLAGRQYKARHILVETKDEADSVIAQLRAGKDFVALAQERASGPTGPNGGDLDWFTAESMPAPFADAVRGMQAGTYSTAPVQTEFGFHVILLEDMRQQAAPALDSIRNELVGALERKRIEDYLKTLREAATVSLGP